ncbi:4872_t:CDS:1, partial [Scutellospora calospora]
SVVYEKNGKTTSEEGEVTFEENRNTMFEENREAANKRRVLLFNVELFEVSMHDFD